MKSVFAILCLVLSLARAHAWNAEGHMVTAQIAYNHLTTSVKAQCDALIATPVVYASNFNNTFVTASVWADDLKSSTNTWNNWHFINFPFSLDGTPTNGFVPPAFDVVQAIRTNIAALQNPSSTQSNRAFHLRLLLHFVGDIQQPLHCTTAFFTNRPTGDAGGNFFPVQDWGNLHSLWDSGGGYIPDFLPRPLSAGSLNILNGRVAVIEANHPYNYATNVGTVADPVAWALEGLTLAQTVCYVGITTNEVPSAGYFDSTYATTEERLAAGGHRLADLLNTILGTNAVTLTAVMHTNNNFEFSWYGLSGRNYQVQWKQNLGDPTWNNLTNITPAANQSISFTEPLNQARRFYRVTQ
ncbi:MAG: S1/P1 nuclease [Verrucomicrobiota bacterium]